MSPRPDPQAARERLASDMDGCLKASQAGFYIGRGTAESILAALREPCPKCEAVQAEPDGRRRALMEKEAELRAEWTRAENAEARAEAAEALLREARDWTERGQTLGLGFLARIDAALAAPGDAGESG